MKLEYRQKERELVLVPDTIDEAFELGQLVEAVDTVYAGTVDGQVAAVVALEVAVKKK